MQNQDQQQQDSHNQAQQEDSLIFHKQQYKTTKTSGRGASFFYKIRCIGDNQYGINIPKDIAIQFQDVRFKLFISNTTLILESGCQRGKF